MEAPPRIELGVKVLQTSALPLGYGAEALIDAQNNTIKLAATSTTIFVRVIFFVFSRHDFQDRHLGSRSRDWKHLQTQLLREVRLGTANPEDRCFSP